MIVCMNEIALDTVPELVAWARIRRFASPDGLDAPQQLARSGRSKDDGEVTLSSNALSGTSVAPLTNHV